MGGAWDLLIHVVPCWVATSGFLHLGIQLAFGL